MFCLLGAVACGAEAPDAEAEDGAVTGANIELPEPVDCVASGAADPLRWMGGAANPEVAGIRSVAAYGGQAWTCSDDGPMGLWSVDADGVTWTASAEACDAVAADEQWLVVARGTSVEVSRRDASEVLARWDGPGEVVSVRLADDRVLVAMGGNGWAELEADGLAEIVRAPQDDVRAVAARDDLRFVAAGRDGVQVVRVVDGAVEPVTRIDVDPALDVVARNGVLAVATLEGAGLIDLAVPESPQFRPTTTPGSALGVALVDDALVVADFTDVAVIEGEALTDVAPLVGSDLLDRSRAVSVDPTSDTVVVAQWDGLHAYDRSCAGQAPAVWPEPRAIDFRVVSAGRSRTLAIPVRNEGAVPLTIDSIETDLPGVTTDFAGPVTVDPRASTAFEVTFDSSGTAPREGAITIVSDDPDQPRFVLPTSANLRGIRVGEPVVPFRNVDTLGRVWEPDDARGKVLLLAYFADW